MAVSTSPLGQRLDAEWEQLAGSRQATRAVARWARLEPAIAGHTTLEQLRGAVHNRGELESGDRILAALVRLAAVSGHGDQLAARVVLQLLVPGAVRLGHTLAPRLGDQATSEAMVFAELTIGVRTYPWQRRPRRIAANLLLDVRQRLTRRAARHWAELPAGLVPGHRPLVTAAGRRGLEADQQQPESAIVVEHLLWWAQRRRIINAREAWLLLARYRDDTPIEALARAAGLSRSTAYALRAGAEQRLRAALTNGPPPTSGPPPAAARPPAWARPPAAVRASANGRPAAPGQPPPGTHRRGGTTPDRSAGKP